MNPADRMDPHDHDPTQERPADGLPPHLRGVTAADEPQQVAAVDEALAAQDPDAALVERVQRGDQRAFELLVVKYQRRIERLIARMVRDVDLIEDIAQETFIRAYRALPNFSGESAFYTWL